MHMVHNVTEDVDEFTSSPTVFFVSNKIVHGGLEGAVETEEVKFFRISSSWQWREEKSLTPPAWEASPSLISCRRRERLDLPWRHVGQSPWLADPPDSEPEIKPRKPGRSRTRVPERFPHSPVSFPKAEKKHTGYKCKPPLTVSTNH